MQKLRVGFDIDGVLLNPHELYLDEIGKIIGCRPVFEEIIDYSFEKTFGISDSEVRAIFDTVLSKKHIPAMPGIDNFAKLVPMLIEPVYFITSRSRKVSAETVLQLNEHLNGFCRFKVAHARTDDDKRISKAILVNVLNLDYFVEDGPMFAREIKVLTEALVLLMDMPWNKDCNVAGIVRCGDWRKGNQWEHVFEFLTRRHRNGLE